MDTLAGGFAVTLDDIEAARQRIAGEASVTPLLRFSTLDERCGGTVYLKAETLQRTGSFKFRGAFNRISLIPETERANGVVACSSGNHAQGVAEAARIYGIPATIVMPADAPGAKVARTKAAGADVVFYDRGTEDRVGIALSIARKNGATFVHPYEDPGVIAGQGTVGLEIADALAGEHVAPDAVLVPCGGGGLTAGLGIAISARFPGTALHTVEPAGFDDHARSFVAGERRANAAQSGSVADALLAEIPGDVTFSINRHQIAGGLVVDDREALEAVAYAARDLKLILEPGGAVALAAVLSGKLETRNRVTVAVLSGGNVDAEMLQRALSNS